MRTKNIFLVATLIITLAAAVGCSRIKVKRTDINKQVDLSGRWNDTDSRMVAESMVQDCLNRPWTVRFSASNSRQPVIIVGTILNKTSEHIDSELFTSDLERSLINSDKAKFVANSPARQELRAEKEDQAEYSSRQTAKPSRQETGADFMLQGTINEAKDEIEGKYVILYQTNLELVDLTTHEKVWFGQKEIKKIVSRSAFGL